VATKFEKTWHPLDGGRSANSNLGSTMPKPDVLKIKNTNNIYVIKLNILNKFYQKESFEIFKQTKFEDEQSINYFLFQFQFHTIVENGLASLTTFHK